MDIRNILGSVPENRQRTGQKNVDGVYIPLKEEGFSVVVSIFSLQARV